MWRIYNDVEPSWKSITEIINFVDKNQDELSKVNGPGGWNDMDMVGYCRDTVDGKDDTVEDTGMGA